MGMISIMDCHEFDILLKQSLQVAGTTGWNIVIYLGGISNLIQTEMIL